MSEHEETPVWLARILEQHGRALVLYARQWCDCPEDVVQQALLALVRQRQQPERVAAWLYRAVRNGAISTSRQQHRRTRREMAAAASVAIFEGGPGAIDAQEAAQALAALPVELREVVVARIWGDLTFAEVADLVGVSLSTAQRRFEQGIRELQARLENPCGTDNLPNAKS